MYNEIISEHFMNPRNIGELESPDYIVEVSNPICGDTVHVFLNVSPNKTITALKYLAYGCSGSIATASILSEKMINQGLHALKAFSRKDIETLLGELEPSQLHCIDFGLEVLKKCAEPELHIYEKKEFLVED
ncbi:iron-sulfur cluster assembly scaffold protein [Mesobacillus zeae]|uniref:Iron-sulfur cluster assembly scaffold protein n=1 Tax=Mesobacillus zeae TaxID=1917180 RepID=A0A398AX44_9BACI|nr:iron-sulfur cluster assembly scaffold protein [Mesobacillus zeae]RID82222.1 iron-sulfur cluster assembly scaffold protein [Mesobacillus zeae]